MERVSELHVILKQLYVAFKTVNLDVTCNLKIFMQLLAVHATASILHATFQTFMYMKVWKEFADLHVILKQLHVAW